VTTRPGELPPPSHDQEARAFHHQHHSALLRYLGWKTSSLETARDLAQDVWSAFSLQQGWANETPTPLLYVIARRRAAGWYRSQRRYGRVILSDQPAEQAYWGLAPDLTEDALALRLAMRDAIALLTVRQREVVVLIYYCDLDCRAVAAILRIGERAVRYHESAALARLRKSETLAPYVTAREEAHR
jgi:RNA polymerase sigma factor (sigma-70 family)